MEPVSPVVTRGLHGSTFTRVSSAAPELRWQASTAPDVTYDVAVWEAAAYRLPSVLVDRYLPGYLVWYEGSINRAGVSMQTPLKPNTKYFWSVRLRKGDVVSSWSRAGHFAFLVVTWTSSRGGWFAFETP